MAMWLTDSGWWAAQPEGADAAGVAARVAAPSGAEPGVLVRSRLTAGGDLVVTQWLTFDDAVRELPVSVEPASIGASDDVATEVRDVTITADDRVVSAQVANLGAGDSTVLDLGPPAREIRLDYVVAGAVEPSQVSAPGRAVVDLNPVHVAVRRRLPGHRGHRRRRRRGAVDGLRDEWGAAHAVRAGCRPRMARPPAQRRRPGRHRFRRHAARLSACCAPRVGLRCRPRERQRRPRTVTRQTVVQQTVVQQTVVQQTVVQKMVVSVVTRAPLGGGRSPRVSRSSGQADSGRERRVA